MFSLLFGRANVNDLIVQATSAGDIRRAEKLYEKALRASPDNTDAAYGLARILVDTKRERDALALMSKPAFAGVTRADWQRTYCKLLAAHGPYDTARAQLIRWIETNPADNDAYLLLSQIYVRQHDFDTAVQTLREGVAAVASDDAIDLQLELADILRRRRDYDGAKAALVDALRAQPPRAEALALAVRCDLDGGNATRGIEHATEFTKHYPMSAEAHALLGAALLANRQIQAAREAARHAISLDEQSLQAQLVAARCDLEQTGLTLALDRMETLASLFPDAPEVHYQLAQLYLHSSPSDAVFHFELCLRNDPLHADAANLLARLLRERGEASAALRHAESVRKHIFYHRDLFYILSILYYEAADYEKSVGLLRIILNHDPDSVDELSQLGLGLRAIGAFREALDVLERAVALKPEHHGACCNLALLKADWGHATEGIALLDHQIALHPNDGLVRWDRALMVLSTGNYENGWNDYELRWHAPGAKKKPQLYPEWDGNDLSCGMLLVIGEQGVGDEIMFASCASDLRGRAARIVIACNPKLSTLFRRSFADFADVISRDDIEREVASLALPRALVENARQITMGSLPVLYRRSLASFPKHSGFLAANHDAIERWRTTLRRDDGRLRIGLSWRGGAASTRKSLRSLDIDDLKRLTRLADADFVNLQYDADADEIATLEHDHGIKLIHFDEALSDYDQTAALTCAVDVVVTVQTALAHLAGALGQRVLVMLPFSPEWRYLRSGSTWPWYPSATLLRQSQPGDWSEPIARVHAALAAPRSLQP